MVNKYSILILIVAAIAYFVYSEFDLMDIVQLEESSDAKCSDGTPYKFQFKLGSEKDKFLLFFEGGGWSGINSNGDFLEDAYQRTNGHLGSSKDYKYSVYPLLNRFFPILSSKEKYNKNFHTYTKIHVDYCDGAGHQGYAKDPVHYKNKTLYFRGYNNTVGILNYLAKNHSFKQAKKVIVSGLSAGGMAALQWSNFIQDFVETKDSVYTISDGGIFPDLDTVDPRNKPLRENRKDLVDYSKPQNTPLHKSIFGDTNNKEIDIFWPESYLRHVKTPVFILNSITDIWPIKRIKQMDCISGKDHFKSCNSTELNIIYQTRQNVFSLIKNNVKPNWSAFLPNYSVHMISVYSTGLYSEAHAITMDNKKYTINDAIEQWLNGNNRIYFKAATMDEIVEEFNDFKDLMYYLYYYKYFD